MVPLFVAAMLLAPLLIVALVAGAASPWTVAPAIVLVLVLLFSSASWQWWRGRIPLGWRLVPLALAVLSVWMLAVPLASSSTTWLVLLTTVIAIAVTLAELVGKGRHDKHDGLAR